MRYRRTSSFNYIEFLGPKRNKGPGCECGEIPDNHIHKPYKWFSVLPFYRQLEILEEEYRKKKK